jgi:hypothetical protein
VNFTCMKIQFSERLRSEGPRSLSTSWHSPSNAHAYRLLIFKERCGFRRNSLIRRQQRGEIMTVFLKPCQHLFFFAFRVAPFAAAGQRSAEP